MFGRANNFSSKTYLGWAPAFWMLAVSFKENRSCVKLMVISFNCSCVCVASGCFLVSYIALNLHTIQTRCLAGLLVLACNCYLKIDRSCQKFLLKNLKYMLFMLQALTVLDYFSSHTSAFRSLEVRRALFWTPQFRNIPLPSDCGILFCGGTMLDRIPVAWVLPCLVQIRAIELKASVCSG